MRFRAGALRSVLLVLFLLLSQQGALLHGFAHEPRAGAHRTELTDHGLAHDEPCATCLAYAGVGAAPPPAAMAVPAVRPAATPPSAWRTAAIAAALAPYAARAPPSFLA